MDPFSVGLGIAGLLPLIAQAIRLCKGYCDGVSLAEASMGALLAELEALHFNVANLHAFLESDAASRSVPRFDQTSVLLTCSASCEAKLRGLITKLSSSSSSGTKTRRLLWPFSEKEHQKTIQELRSFSSWLRFALSVDGAGVLAQTAEGVLRVLGAQLEQFAALRAVDETLGQDRDRRARRQVLAWISTTTSHAQKHAELCASRTRNTGDWLLQKQTYLAWRDGGQRTTLLSTSSCQGIQQGSDKTNHVISIIVDGDGDGDGNTLWCHGIQGSGKTNLVSIIVDDLQTQITRAQAQTQTQSTPVAFFYLSHADRQAQTSHAVLSCLLRQVLEQVPSLPETVRAVYDTAQAKGGGALSAFECERLLAEVLGELPRAYLVLDALDECADEHRGSLLRTLGQLGQLRGVRVLVTSRPHVNEIPATLKNHTSIKIAARDSDIKLYIDHELHRKGVYKLADDEFIQEIIERLSGGADGMFLLPVLQLRTILQEPTLGDMEDSLARLSHNLSEAFEETLARIQSLSPSQRRIGMSSLLYLAHAARPLTVDELSDLLAMDPRRTRVAPKYRPSARTLLECGQGLIAIDGRTGNVRTAHHSIQEYLLENDARLFPGAEALLASHCLRYVLLDDFASGPWDAADQVRSYLDGYPFLSYATRFWGRHAKASEGDPRVQAQLAAFFASRPAMAVANQVRQFDMGRRYEYWGPAEGLSFTPLHYAARHGLIQTVRRLLLDEAGFDVNVVTHQGATPIIHAASNGHVAAVRILLERGADPYLRNWYGDALHCAIEGNQAGTIRELVRWGMDPSGPKGHDDDARSYLGCALDGDAARALEALVQLGVDIHAQQDRCRTDTHTWSKIHFFFQACNLGCQDIVGLMLDRGWVDVNMRSVGGLSALYWATAGGCLAVVQKLVDAGADVHAVDDDGVSPLLLMRKVFRPSALDSVLGGQG